jgi:beta-lactamase regulating signal transducer with metallopeptidase domain
VGFIRPCILLPRGWREWSDHKCRGVLAHELAHVRWGDFAKRIAGHFCVIVHFYHPIAHWLMARLRLQQELAADSRGVRLAGGRSLYLTTLAQMALRHDADEALGFDCSLLAFDGLFLRRIDMLYRDTAFGRATESSPGRIRCMTFGLLGLVAVLAAALRAPLAPAADPESPTVNDQVAVSQRDAEVPFDLSRVPAEAVGVVAFRPSSLVGIEAIQLLKTWA